jgi:hypothetical protein
MLPRMLLSASHFTVFSGARDWNSSISYRQGLSEKEAMEISGHKTRAVFDRYHIVSERRMKQNAEKLEAHLKTKEAAEAVTDVGDRQARRPN